MFENVRGNPVRLAQLAPFLGAFAGSAMAAMRDADVVHAHWLFPAGIIAALTAPRQCPVVVTVHSTDFHLLRRIPGGRAVARAIVRRCDQVHFVAQYLQEAFSAWLGHSQEVAAKSVVVPMGIAAPEPSPSVDKAREPRIGFIGRLIAMKGVDDLLHACDRVRPRGVLIAGAGPDEARLREIAARMGIPHQFVGTVAGEQKARFFSDCEIVVFPSRRYPSGRTEGMPVALLEALGSGRVVVAAAVGGIPEVLVHGANGYLFPAGDREALTRLLQWIITNWASASRVANAARQTSAEFRTSVLGLRHEDLYGRATARNSLAQPVLQ